MRNNNRRQGWEIRTGFICIASGVLKLAAIFSRHDTQKKFFVFYAWGVRESRERGKGENLIMFFLLFSHLSFFLLLFSDLRTTTSCGGHGKRRTQKIGWRFISNCLCRLSLPSSSSALSFISSIYGESQGLRGWMRYGLGDGVILNQSGEVGKLLFFRG